MASPRLYDSRLTVDAPNFAPPTTPTRSPYKDTLHRRSPTKQLRPGKDALDYDEYHKLMKSGTSTAAEKELASRVLDAAERLKAWCQEIEQWGWSGHFDKHNSPGEFESFDQIELCASLSADQVEAYDSRLNAIEEDFHSLSADEFKEQIRGIHLDRSRPSSSYSVASSANLILFDGFQLFVTDALIYLLPYQAKLEHSLKMWHVRVAVFKEVPGYLRGLKLLDDILKDAWASLRDTSKREVNGAELDDLAQRWTQAQESLRACITEFGLQLDRMLDLLEGYDDCLPNSWIDKFEHQEKSFADWAYESERKIFQLRLLEQGTLAHQEELTSLPRDAQMGETVATVTAPETGSSEVLPGNNKFSKTESTEHTSASPTIEERIGQTEGEIFPTLGAEGEETGPESAEDLQEDAIIAEVVHRPVEAVLRRASVASIGSFTRDQVKSVDVPSRRNSAASFGSTKQLSSRGLESPVHSSPIENSIQKSSKPTSPLAVETTAEWPDIHYNSEKIEPETPLRSELNIRSGSVSSAASNNSEISENGEDGEDGEESPSMRASKNQLSKPPLNNVMKKRRGNNLMEQFRVASNPFPEPDLHLNTSATATPSSPTKHKSPVSPSIPLEDQISSILESLPARIRLKSGPAPNAPEIKPSHARRTSTSSNVSTTSDASRPVIRSRAVTPSLSARPTITLAPAEDVGLRRGVNDPEIKIYHLVSGNEKPLKLFVRRVGENGERVMVRVGGGWADLGEYLKNYAEHHGHRTVSEGGVQVLGLGNDRSGTPTLASGGRNSSMGFRSDSRMEGRSESRLGMRAESRQSVRQESRRSSLVGSIGYPSLVATANPNSSPVTTSDSPFLKTAPSSAANTPAGLSDNTTPTSANSHRRTSSFWEDGGLMGPAATRKGSEISEEKKEWVDSIVEQAKKVGRKVEFGDLGKKGGTRRVFLKGKNGTGPE